MTSRTSRSLVTLVLAVAGLWIASPAFAGPPLLCHPFDIGSARSLPWSGQTAWFQGKEGYNVADLVRDTEALLTPATPVVVRMETLRRAAIYASRDRAVAGELLMRLSKRIDGQINGSDALTYLDLAYVVGAFKEISGLDHATGEFAGRAAYLRPLVAHLDSYELVTKSLLLRPGDPSLEFAAALIAADGNRAAYAEHARRARAGAHSDALLTRNIGHVSAE